MVSGEGESDGVLSSRTKKEPLASSKVGIVRRATTTYLDLSHHKKMRPQLERNSSEKIQVAFLCEELITTSHNEDIEHNRILNTRRAVFLELHFNTILIQFCKYIDNFVNISIATIH